MRKDLKPAQKKESPQALAGSLERLSIAA